MKKTMKLWNKFLHTLEACWLCIRFPFLYPRNRFTGRHRVNLLHKLLWKLRNESIQEISITGKLEKDETELFGNRILKPNKEAFVLVNKESTKLSIGNTIDCKELNLSKLLWEKDKFKILGISSWDGYGNNFTAIVHVKTIDETDTTNYGFHYERVELVTNRFKYFLYKVFDWIDSEILDRICFIPTYTELDALEEGWRKAFGIQLCKEIKQALKKNNYLYKYRITQIKEKFGILHWYDEGAPKEVYDIISKYEDISWNTCIICGKPATKISAGWISPFCNDCFPKDGLVYMKKWKDGKYHQVKRKQLSCMKK